MPICSSCKKHVVGSKELENGKMCTCLCSLQRSYVGAKKCQKRLEELYTTKIRKELQMN